MSTALCLINQLRGQHFYEALQNSTLQTDRSSFGMQSGHDAMQISTWSPTMLSFEVQCLGRFYQACKHLI